MKRIFVREAASVVILTLTGLLLAIIGGCGYDSTTPYPPDDSSVAGLWTSSGLDPALLRLAPSQLLTSNDRVPATAISTSSAELLN